MASLPVLQSHANVENEKFDMQRAKMFAANIRYFDRRC